MLHFVAAVAHAHGAMRGGADNLTCTLIVENRKREVRRHRRFVDKNPSQLGLAGGEERPDEFFFDVQVLIEEFRQGFLVNILPDTHQGKLEESGHGRGQREEGVAILFCVQEKTAVCEGLKNATGCCFRLLPDPGSGSCCEGFDGEKGDKVCFLFGKEEMQDSVKQCGRRSSLREQIQPVGQPAVGRACGKMRHLASRGVRGPGATFPGFPVPVHTGCDFFGAERYGVVTDEHACLLCGGRAGVGAVRPAQTG